MSWRNKKLKIIRIGLKLARRLPWPKQPKQVYLRDRITQYRDVWQTIAQQVGADFSEIDKDMWELQKGETLIRARLHELPLDTNVVLKLCGRKPLVHKLLSRHKIPVPEHQLFDLNDLDAAEKFLLKRPNGCVVKPCDGYAGLGVTTHIQSVSALERAATRASLYLDDLMIEEQIPGENFRILVYKGKMLNAVRRPGQHITGDGTSTIDQLIAAIKNFKHDNDLTFTLISQNLSLSSIPQKNQKVLIKSVGSNFNGGIELRTIYEQDVTDQVHESVRNDAENCAKIAQANLAGIDIITTDISKNLRETGGIINEINTTPAFHHHYDDKVDPFPKSALFIMQDLFSKS